jgi:hypothetical protein
MDIQLFLNSKGEAFALGGGDKRKKKFLKMKNAVSLEVSYK